MGAQIVSNHAICQRTNPLQWHLLPGGTVPTWFALQAGVPLLWVHRWLHDKSV